MSDEVYKNTELSLLEKGLKYKTPLANFQKIFPITKNTFSFPQIMIKKSNKIAKIHHY